MSSLVGRLSWQNWLLANKTHKTAPPLLPAALVWLLMGVGLALAPHVLRLPLWLSGLFVGAAVWRWFATVNNTALPRSWVLSVLTLGTIASVFVYYGTLLGRDAGVGLLTAMAALKLLEARALRDGIVLVFLGYFIVVANFLYSQSVFTVVYLLAVVVLLLSAQILLHPQHKALQPLACLKLSALMLLQAVPVMVILFVLFPRIPGPLWGLPSDAHSGLSGLSDSMTPGSISELIQSDEVAFRVRFADDSRVPSAAHRYWRGPVLWQYQDSTWRGGREPLRRTLPYTPLGEPIDYTVTLEPSGKRWLFALELPGMLPDGAGITATRQLKRVKPINVRDQYTLHSYLTYRDNTTKLSADQRRRYLQLPSEGNHQTRQLAQQWRAQTSEPAALVARAQAFYREQPFYYTLTPPLLGVEGIDEFLFDTRRGFCEHYAGSFVFLMRAAGIPARVVLGYQGGERNDDYYIVRQSDAHAWAEVWLDGAGGGWRRVDPTAAVSPLRIESGIYAAADNPDRLPLMARREASWLRDLALSWDAVNHAWNDWVLGYDTNQQRSFLSSLGLGPVDWRQMTIALTLALLTVTLIATGIYAWRVRNRQDALARVFQQFCRKLARYGLTRQPHEGPLAFTARVAEARPELATEVAAIGRLYARQRYGAAATVDDGPTVKQLQRLVTALK